MVVRISELKLPVSHGRKELEREICRILHIRQVRIKSADEEFPPSLDESQKKNGKAPVLLKEEAAAQNMTCGADPVQESLAPEYEIVRRSIDARKKPDLFYVYTIDVHLAHPQAAEKKLRNRHVTAVEPKEYVFPYSFTEQTDRPVVVGCGPAGLFCALMLARAGLRPIILERGEDVDKRTESVRRFWETGELNPSSNVQFGEGGAGTFSDGKLNTLIRDPDGRIRFVLREFIKAGADPSILWNHKPHIGTDVLVRVVKHLRKEIASLGGEVRFETCLTGICPMEHYVLELNGGMETLCASRIVLAIGHSARDTFQMLYDTGFSMEAKAFAVGLRIQHSQAMINQALYGTQKFTAPYKLTHKCKNGRGVYSFCMCPGGYVVNASSEPGMTAVNGMSYSDRGGKNANSAIVVTVTPEDCRNFAEKIQTVNTGEPDTAKTTGTLAGIAFQREMEKAAFRCGDGKIPVQRFEDYCRGIPSKNPGCLPPENRGQWKMADLRPILPEELNTSIIEGMHAFGHKISGFDGPDVLLCGVESRTSSPVRILRDADSQSVSHPGIFPCGEGAGYAGGITSAAVDGIRVAEAVCRDICSL